MALLFTTSSTVLFPVHATHTAPFVVVARSTSTTPRTRARQSAKDAPKKNDRERALNACLLSTPSPPHRGPPFALCRGAAPAR
jgi:hypothetical protein